MTCSVDGSDDVHGVQCELAAEVLRCCGTLRLQVTGWSMLPAIWPGDILFVETATTNGVREGDVVLFGRDRRFCAHRIVKKLDGSKFVTRGDANPWPDPVVHSEQLLGRVSSIVKNEKRIVVRSSRTFFERAIAAIVRHSHLCARILVSVRGWAAIS
jgi:signal peptidase I